MTWVKVCGITNLDDALAGVQAGADALGFVFYEKSPRNIDLQVVQEITRKLPHDIEKIGVFVDQDFAQVGDIMRRAGLTGAQIFRREVAASFVRDRNADRNGRPRIIYVLQGRQITEKDFLSSVDLKQTADIVLIDSGSATQLGGTGRSFDWTGARATIAEIAAVCPVIVAGGLTPSNVSDAMRILKPWGVDVSSGVEVRPGKKDPVKVQAFVAAVRQADKEV